jgi:hypothetical protein
MRLLKSPEGQNETEAEECDELNLGNPSLCIPPQ